MPSDRTRRGLLGALLGGTVAGAALSPARWYLDTFAPLSGSAWNAVRTRPEGTVDSPYGDATVRYDDYGVPHIDADSEPAAYFAVGYAHAGDRLLQMDVQRRQLRGQLSEVAGEATVESDEFHRKMDFAAAADANVERLAGTETEPIVDAYVDGVNACIDNEPLPLEFELLDFEPAPWTVADAMLMEKSIAWSLSGRFRPLHRANAIDQFGRGITEELYPEHLDHGSPIVRERERTAASRTTGFGDNNQAGGTTDRLDDSFTDGYGPLTDWLSSFEPPPGTGSNSWIVSGDHTDSGKPMLANDPHLQLQTPPVWYEQHVSTDEYDARGAAFPGQPFVIIGRNATGAWGVTNPHVDLLDVYEYETDGDSYRYGDEWRSFDVREETIPVADAPDETITVRKTVHGPYLEQEGHSVGVAWTGLTGTATVQAIHRFAKHDSFDEFLDATRQFDLPSQNLVYANDTGRTLYALTGRLPIRQIDGEAVHGNQIFNGSEKHGEWNGFEPYGQSSWDGFVPFDEKPVVVDPDYLATANQTIAFEFDHYIGPDYSSPFRGQRTYELLDDAAENGDIDAEYMERMQLDVLDKRLEAFRSAALSVRDAVSDDGQTLLDEIEAWDGQMTRESTGALAFTLLADAYERTAFEEPLDGAGVDRLPLAWTMLTLEADAAWFDRQTVPDRSDALAAAVDAAADLFINGEADTYGEHNVLDIAHPFEVDFLGYDPVEMDGSPSTLRNVRADRSFGTSWAMIVSLGDAESRAILPGGNDGRYGSPNYADQLPMWAAGEYKPLQLAHDGDTRFTFRGEDDD